MRAPLGSPRRGHSPSDEDVYANTRLPLPNPDVFSARWNPVPLAFQAVRSE